MSDIIIKELNAEREGLVKEKENKANQLFDAHAKENTNIENELEQHKKDFDEKCYEISDKINGICNKLKSKHIADFIIHFLSFTTIFPFILSMFVGALRYLQKASNMKKAIFVLSKEGVKARLKAPVVSIFLKNARSLAFSDSDVNSFVLKIIGLLLLCAVITTVVIFVAYFLAEKYPRVSREMLEYDEAYSFCRSRLSFFEWGLSPIACRKKIYVKLSKVYSIIITVGLVFYIGVSAKAKYIALTIALMLLAWLVALGITLLTLRLPSTIIGSILFMSEKSETNALNEEYEKLKKNHIDFEKSIADKQNKSDTEYNKALNELNASFNGNIALLDEKIKKQNELIKLEEMRNEYEKVKAEMLERFGGDLKRITKYADSNAEFFLLCNLQWERYRDYYIKETGNTDYDVQYDLLKAILDCLKELKNVGYLPAVYFEEIASIEAEFEEIKKHISNEKKNIIQKKNTEGKKKKTNNTGNRDKELEKQYNRSIERGKKLWELSKKSSSNKDMVKTTAYLIESARLGCDKSVEMLKYLVDEYGLIEAKEFSDYYVSSYITIKDITQFLAPDSQYNLRYKINGANASRANKGGGRNSEKEKRNEGNAYGLNHTNANATGSVYNMKESEHSFSNIPDLNTRPSDYAKLSDVLDDKIPNRIKNDPLMKDKVVHPDGSIHIDVSDM